VLRADPTSGRSSRESGARRRPPIDDETFFVEYTIDERDDWKSEAALRKANPNFDVSVAGDFLRARQRDAIASRARPACSRPSTSTCGSPRRRPISTSKPGVAAGSGHPDQSCRRHAARALRGRRCIAGLDLASKVDIAALELLFPPIGAKATREDPYIRIGFYFVPSARILLVPAYQGWDALGLLNVTEGDIIDYDEILEVLREIRGHFQLEMVAYDPHQATMMVTTM
jgi:phage terminase large subunit-like protein